MIGAGALLAGIWSCESCGKEPALPSTVEGVVVDGKTGMGLADVKITYTTAVPDGPDFEPSVTHNTTTNSEGDFILEVPPRAFIISTVYFKKAGYVNLVNVIETNQSNLIRLWLNDSWLKLVVRNDLPLQDSIYIRLKNKSLYPGLIGGPGPDYPVVLGFGEEIINYFPSSSNTYTAVRWGFTAMEQVNNPMIDSLLMPANDTIEYIISY